jgi:hypothetical protein
VEASQIAQQIESAGCYKEIPEIRTPALHETSKVTAAELSIRQEIAQSGVPSHGACLTLQGAWIQDQIALHVDPRQTQLQGDADVLRLAYEGDTGCSKTWGAIDQSYQNSGSDTGCVFSVLPWDHHSKRCLAPSP